MGKFSLRWDFNYYNLITARVWRTGVSSGTDPQWISSYACGFKLWNSNEIIVVGKF